MAFRWRKLVKPHTLIAKDAPRSSTVIEVEDPLVIRPPCMVIVMQMPTSRPTWLIVDKKEGKKLYCRPVNRNRYRRFRGKQDVVLECGEVHAEGEGVPSAYGKGV